MTPQHGLDLTDALIFALGWASCCGFMGLWHWLTRLGFEPFAEPYGDVVTWPTDFELHHARMISGGAQHDHA